MSSPIQILLNESQKNLLQQKEITCMVEPDMERALSVILSKDNKWSLTPEYPCKNHLVKCIMNNPRTKASL